MLIGRLGQDPEIRNSDGENSVANFSIATNDFWTDKQGQKQERTEWHSLVLWNRLADLSESYLRKGSQIYVEGALQTRSWEDQQGNKKYKTEVKVFKMEFLDQKESEPETERPEPKPEPSSDTWHDREESNNDQLNIKRIQSKFADAGNERRSETETQGVRDDIPF